MGSKMARNLNVAMKAVIQMTIMDPRLMLFDNPPDILLAWQCNTVFHEIFGKGYIVHFFVCLIPVCNLPVTIVNI